MTTLKTNIKDFLGFTFFVALALIVLYTVYAIAFNVFYWMTNQKIPEEGMYVIKLYKIDSLDHATIDLEPNLRQVKKFLRENKIDERDYDLEEYNCEDFSEDFVEDFMNAGFFSCTVDLLWFNKTGNRVGHQMVTVKTEESEIIIIEPQSDRIYYNLDIGDKWSNNTIKIIKSCFEHKELIE